MATKKKHTKNRLAFSNNTLLGLFIVFCKQRWVEFKQRQAEFLTRRPHRSFRLTRRRDYKRSWAIAGYWSFSNYVRAVLWQHKKTFGVIALVFSLLTVLLVGIASQQNYTELRDGLAQASTDAYGGDGTALVRVVALFGVAISGGLNVAPTEGQQIFGGLLLLFAWLSVVWLLRHMLAGHRVVARDGIYSSGAPIIPTFLVALVILVQLLPIGLALIGYVAAENSGLLIDNGLLAALLGIIATLLAVVSLYWITSSIIALVVVTLPGMYPLAALKTAGDLVVGRRIRVLLRLLWLTFLILIVWAAALVPLLLIDNLLEVNALAIVPVTVLILGAVSVVFSAAYVYLLYRKLVDDETPPA